MIEGFGQDLKHGARMLAKNPGFAFTAIVSIAIGVGANAGMFSLADTFLLRPLTVPRASDIVTITSVVPRSGFASPTSSALSYPDYIDVRDNARSFASLMAYRLVVASLADRAGQPARRKFGVAVSGNLFDALGVPAARGGVFGVEQDRVVGRDPVVVLDHDFWTQQFGSDPDIVGRRFRLGGVEMTVAGVMPRGFTGPDQFIHPAFYIPLAMLPALQGLQPDELTRRDVRNLAVKGRLAADVTLTRAREEVQLIGANLQRSYPNTNRDHTLTVMTEFGARVDARPQLAVFAATLITLAVAVLLVACANVAGLLVSRAPVRAREMALRLAIGAGRLRLMRQLLVESLLVAGIGGAVGLGLGYGVIRVFQQIQLPTDVPLKLGFDLDERVFLVGIGVAALGALLSSLVPAWKSTRVDLITSLKSQAAADPHRSRLWGRNTLVCGQVALSLVLMTLGVFLYRAFQMELGRGPGFRIDHVLLMAFDPDIAGYDDERAERFYQLLREKVQTLPGVKSVALTSSVPFDGLSIENTAVAPEGYQFPAGTEDLRVLSARVDEGYFETLGIGIVSGRAFRATDARESPRVAVVNQSFAARYWPQQDPVGKRVRLTEDDQTWVQVVGVAANHKYRALLEGRTAFVYYPQRQRPANDNTILVHTESDPALLAATLRDAVGAIDPNVPTLDVRTMEEFYYASSVTFTHLIVGIIGGMGLIGLVLAMVGLYGLVAYTVSRRTREIGVRIAVGANPSSVLRMVLRYGLLLAVGGVVAGLTGSVAMSGLLRAIFPFPDAERMRLTTYFLVVPALLAITLLAAYIPARRAARIDPLMALRHE
jgi:predicted permease